MTIEESLSEKTSNSEIQFPIYWNKSVDSTTIQQDVQKNKIKDLNLDLQKNIYKKL